MRTLQLLLCLLALNVGFGLQAQDYYLYVSDAGGFNNQPWKVMRYNIDGSNPQVFVDNDFFVSEGLGWPQDILFLEDQGVALIASLVGGRITKHNANTGAYIDDFAAITGGPTRMKIGPDGLIYVIQWSNSINKVLRFEQDGTFVDEFTDEGVPTSIGIDWDGDGNLYISSYGGSSVTQFNSNGESQGVFIDSNLSGPTNIHRESDGNFLVLNWNGGNIQRFDASGNHLGLFTSEVSQPEGIAEHPISGNYIVGNGGAAQIDEFDADGNFVQTIVSAGSGGLLQPNAVVVRQATLSVGESKIKKAMVTPTVGNRFSLAASLSRELNTLEAYNLFGQKVADIELDQSYWDASYLSEGIYILKGTHNSQTFVQKIAVKN